MRKLFYKNLNWLKTFTIFLVTFSAGFFVLKNLPANKNLSCAVGANFTLLNLIILAIFCIIFAVNCIIITEINIKKNYNQVGLVGFSFLIMSLASICTLCLLPAVVLFGFSIGLSFIALHNLYFQLIALALAGFSTFMLVKTYNDQCLAKCEVIKKRG